MVKTEHAFQLIRKELMEECDQPKNDETTPAADSTPNLNQEEVIKLLSIFESRLSFLLLQSIKLLSTSKRKMSNAEEDAVLQTNKQIYSQLLRATANRNSTVLERIEVIICLLEQLASGSSGSSSSVVP